MNSTLLYYSHKKLQYEILMMVKFDFLNLIFGLKLCLELFDTVDGYIFLDFFVQHFANLTMYR